MNKLLTLCAAFLAITAISRVIPASDAPPPSEESAVIHVDGSSAEVDLDSHVPQGHVTIVDVFSEACPPCRKLSPLLDKLTEKKSALRVVKLDIGTIQKGKLVGINWGSPVIRQFGISSIPYLMVYDERGQRMLEGDGAYEKVISWLEEEGIGD